MNAQRMLFGLVMAAGVAGLAGPGYGQAKPDSPVAQAQKAVTEAAAGVTAAKAELARARQKVVIAFKAQTPDYAKAEEDLAKSKLEMQQAELAAKHAVQTSAAYKAAMTAKLAAQEKITSAATEADRSAASNENLRQVSLINRMEREGLEKSPKLAEAKVKNAEASRTMETFKGQIEDLCKSDPEYAAAEQKVTAAEQTHKQAAEALASARKSAAEAAAAEAKAKAEARKAERESKRASSGSGGSRSR